MVTEVTEAPKPILLPLTKALHLIGNADLLLFRSPRSAIASGSRSIYSHAAMAAWWGDRLMLVEVLQWYGGRAVTLASQVSQYPGRYDVYRWDRSNQVFIPTEAVRWMQSYCGWQYGWCDIAKAAARHLPLISAWMPAPVDDRAESHRLPSMCSGAFSIATRRGGGVDPVPNLSDRATEPADLARSAFYKYQFTLAAE